MDLAGRKCLLVGGDQTAARKLRLLVRAGARPVVLATNPVPEIQTTADAGKISVLPRGFTPSDLEDVALVIVADTPSDETKAIAHAARRAGVPLNVIDQPDLCTVILPGIIDRDPILVAVGSGGASPVLVRRVREKIESVLPPRLGHLAQFAGRFRGAVTRVVVAGRPRRAFWERVLDGPIGAKVLRGEEPAASEAMLRLINSPNPGPAASGRVALVGAGPGAADLLTLRALRLLQDADVVVHDALVADEVLDLIRRDATRIDVGKRKGNHRLSQTEINRLLVEQARAGHSVVRLKGGDPFLFGRGGEEMEHLRTEGIDVEIVPGITAALGAAASTGIPLTHRDHASAVTFVTGQASAGANDAVDVIDAIPLGGSGHTVVVYMGLGNARRISTRLIAGGHVPSTPVAVIDRATLADQRVLHGHLAGLGDLVEQSNLAGPALFIIGDVTAASGLAPEIASPLRAIA
jgi:uroporphyrin-III C-methyltransferase/precorrin-2 dehydrogenase/sirohydrochlorin ferrochelatase